QKLSEEEMKALIKGFTDKLRAEHRAEMQKIASTNQKLEEEFLSENRTKSEVQELPSGLQYKVLGQGSGTSPKLDQVVKVNYEGRMLNGTVFTPRGEREIDLTATLLGLQEALTLMRPGDHWEVYVPAKMAWGEAERGPVTPNSLLIFDLELLEILP
ncbi:MAG: FKBP-type peptidyl-prolyl cis-trans isomerase, partial [Bacteroidota bacterium]